MIQKVQRTVEVPQVEYVDNHIEIPVHKQRHIPMVTVSQRHVDVPVIQTVEKIVDVPVVKQIDVPHITTIEKIVEVPQVQHVQKTVEVQMEGQTLQGNQNHSMQTLPAQRQQAPAEQQFVEVDGPPMPTETMEPTVVVAPPAPVQIMQAPVQTYKAPVPVQTYA